MKKRKLDADEKQLEKTENLPDVLILDSSENDKSAKNSFINKFIKKKDKTEYTFADNPHLLELRPREQYLFYSDYFKLDDDTFSCILSTFHSNGATDRFGQSPHQALLNSVK